MTRGLIWLPLLALFIGLAWAGWNEYQKVEAYRVWAESFDRAKYDIYSVLGQKGDEITWGKPTRNGPIELETFSLKRVTAIQVYANEHTIDLEVPPPNGEKVALVFQFIDDQLPLQIPFTDLSLAVQWAKALQREWQQYV